MALSYEVIMALIEGEQLVMDLPEVGIWVQLSCDDAATQTFRDEINQALLRMLPVGSLPN